MAQLSARTQWLIVFGLSLGPAVSNGFGRFAYGLILPAMKQDLSWTYTQAGWINTANAIGYLIGALVGLRYIVRFGPRALFIGGMIVMTVTLLASGCTRNFWLLTLWRIAAGIGGAPVFIAGGAMASTLFRTDASRNALVIAAYFGGGGLGMLLTALTIPFILDRAGAGSWPATWLLLGALSALATAISVPALRAIPLAAQRASGESHEPLPVARMAAALAGYFLYAVGYIVYLTFLVAWMRVQGAGPVLIATTWALLGLAVMASPLVWRRALAVSSGGGALAGACAATGVGTLLPMIVPGAAGLWVSAAIFGGSFFIGPAAVTTFSRKNLPEAAWGRSIALFTAIFAFGQTLGPTAAGLIADSTHSLAFGLSAAGVTLLLAAAVATLQRALTVRHA